MKCLQAILCEEQERPAEKLCFGGEGNREPEKKRGEAKWRRECVKRQERALAEQFLGEETPARPRARPLWAIGRS